MSGKSFAHSRKDLPGGRRVLEKAGRSKTPFEKAQAQQPKQGSHMVQRSRPQPQHKPSPQLAAGADRQAFNDNWERERKRAQFIAERVKSAHQRRRKDRMRE